MILLIDTGNTRIKWGLRDCGRWIEQGALAHAEVLELRTHIAGRAPILRTLGTHVAGTDVAERISAALAGLAPPVEWIRASASCCGVRNRYLQAEQLGPDRWAALIGARRLAPGRACLVVTAGTATTIDVLSAEGEFSGGVILPGEELMRRSLAGNTARLPMADGELVALPRCTMDAITSGCLHAQAGAIERMYEQISGQDDPQCLLNGGAAERIAPALRIPFLLTDNLVLEGLAAIAENHTPDVGA